NNGSFDSVSRPSRSVTWRTHRRERPQLSKKDRLLQDAGHSLTDMPNESAKRTRRDQALPSPPVPHGPRAYGYGPGYAVVKVEARRLRAVASRVIGGDTLRAIVADLNRRGITNSRGRPWTIQTLRHVLLNPHTAGLGNTSARVQSWPGALDPNTHKRLVAILGDPTRRTN